MADTGVVSYKIEPGNNTIRAVWYFSGSADSEPGSGLAIGNTKNGFPGNYAVTYIDAKGKPVGTFDLSIKEAGAVFNLSWSVDGKVVFVGVGIEVDDRLVASYAKV